MAGLNMNYGTFQTVPAGEQVLLVESVKCVPSGKPNKIVVVYKSQSSGSINASFQVSNDKAIFAFSMLFKAITGSTPEIVDFKDIPSMLEKKYVLCDVVHNLVEKNDDSGDMLTFANVKKTIKMVDGYVDGPTQQLDDNIIPEDDEYGI